MELDEQLFPSRNWRGSLIPRKTVRKLNMSGSRSALWNSRVQLARFSWELGCFEVSRVASACVRPIGIAQMGRKKRDKVTKSLWNCAFLRTGRSTGLQWATNWTIGGLSDYRVLARPKCVNSTEYSVTGLLKGENSDLRLIEYRSANLPVADRQAFWSSWYRSSFQIPSGWSRKLQ